MLSVVKEQYLSIEAEKITLSTSWPILFIMVIMELSCHPGSFGGLRVNSGLVRLKRTWLALFQLHISSFAIYFDLLNDMIGDKTYISCDSGENPTCTLISCSENSLFLPRSPTENAENRWSLCQKKSISLWYFKYFSSFWHPYDYLESTWKRK
jgi:hypothetical protein